MRNIRPEWRNLARGLERVEDLEARFRAEWAPRLEEAQRKRAEAARQQARRHRRAALVAALFSALLLLAVALALFLVSSPAADGAFGLALVVPPAVLVLYGAVALLSTPIPAPLPLVPSDFTRRWWGQVSGRTPPVHRTGPALSARSYGDVGEKSFVSHLAGALPKEYVAVRGLLVARRLDADVIVVGPTGIWVYEVKHWTGEIACERGRWSRTKTYRGPGGRLVRETEGLNKSFDRQWVKEANSVKEALRRNLRLYPHLHEAVRGGIVFTYPGSSYVVDGSCRARVYTSSTCVEALSVSPQIPNFTMDKRLHAIDALLKWSDGLHEQQGQARPSTSSAVELAERLHEDAVSRASFYLSSMGEPGDADFVSEDIREAGKEAV